MTKQEKKRFYAKALACLRAAKRHRGKNERRYMCWIRRADRLVQRVAQLEKCGEEPCPYQPNRKRLAVARLRLQRLMQLLAEKEQLLREQALLRSRVGQDRGGYLGGRAHEPDPDVYDHQAHHVV